MSRRGARRAGRRVLRGVAGDSASSPCSSCSCSLFVVFSLTQERFFTSANIKALLTSAAILWVVSIGLTFVMLAGGFDLSIGSMLALSSIALGAFVNDFGLPAGVAVVLRSPSARRSAAASTACSSASSASRSSS